MNVGDYLAHDCGDWWLYRLPDGRQVRVDINGPLRFAVDVEGGVRLSGQTSEQVEELLRRLVAGRG